MSHEEGSGRESGAIPEAEELQLASFQPLQLEQLPPCQGACPNCGDIRGWIGVVAQRGKTTTDVERAYARAWKMIADINPFPATVGRICPHPCESHCNRSEADGAVAIHTLERFLGDWAIENELPLTPIDRSPKPEWIGVVGAGPSGLSFAFQMARRGYRVTVYERHEHAGGMLRYGIPDYRLPPDILDAEINRILALGVELQLDTEVGRDITPEELKERHTVLYVGIGAQKGRGLGLPGEEGPGVWTGTGYLERVNRGEAVAVGRSAVVVGGGSTAMDAARMARRAGAEVTVLYRRSRAEMPAEAEEVDDALAEGVAMEFLAAPVEILRNGDGLQGLVVRRMELGPPDESGRRAPLPVQGSEFEVAADCVIAAVSQEPDWASMDTIKPDGRWLSASETGEVTGDVWAGGDVLGLGIAGIAIFQGRKAAEVLHARLRNLPPPPEDTRPPVGPDAIDFGFHEERAPTRQERITPSEAVARPSAEVSQGLTAEQFEGEAQRCLSCGTCFGCQQCYTFCSAQCFTRLEEPRPGMYFSLSLEACRECGKCVDLCPCGYLTMA